MILQTHATTTLRDYQQQAVNQIVENWTSGRVTRQVLVAPTGAGKTEMAQAIIAYELESQKRVAFICDLETLVSQTKRRFSQVGFHCGILKGQHPTDITAPIQICSAQTLVRRKQLPEVDTIIIDEAHTQYDWLCNAIVQAKLRLLGLTATPFAVGMANIYEQIVCTTTTMHLTQVGFLVPVKALAAQSHIDMSGAKLVRGEWSDAVAEQRALRIVGDIAAEWTNLVTAEFGRPVPTLVFTPTIDFGKTLQQQFAECGYVFEQVTAHDSDQTKAQKIDQLRSGALHGLISVEALAKGVDIPEIQCLVSARPYRKSLTYHVQQIGRGLRPSYGKTHVLLIDHGGNWMRFWPETYLYYRDGVNTLRKKKEDSMFPPGPCWACGEFTSGTECEFCGASLIPESSGPGNKPALLTGAVQWTAWDPEWHRKCYLWSACQTVAKCLHPEDPDRAKRWAFAQFRKYTGCWPDQWQDPTLGDVHVSQRVACERIYRVFRAWRKINVPRGFTKWAREYDQIFYQYLDEEVSAFHDEQYAGFAESFV